MKFKKVVISLLILLSISNFATATQSIAAISITDINSKAETFKNAGKGAAKISEEEALQNFIPVGQVLVLVASIVLVIATIVMGIKWIIGNPEQKGKLKEQMIGLIIAIVVVYGGVGIWAFGRAVMNGL